MQELVLTTAQQIRNGLLHYRRLPKEKPFVEYGVTYLATPQPKGFGDSLRALAIQTYTKLCEMAKQHADAERTWQTLSGDQLTDDIKLLESGMMTDEEMLTMAKKYTENYTMREAIRRALSSLSAEVVLPPYTTPDEIGVQLLWYVNLMQIRLEERIEEGERYLVSAHETANPTAHADEDFPTVELLAVESAHWITTITERIV